MKIVLALLFVLGSGWVHADKSSAVFGDAMPDSPLPISLGAAIAGLETGDQPEENKISGTITEVCKKKGCWMILTDGDTYARVTFKDYGFFVPKDSGQRDAIVLGTLSSKELSAKDANHYAKDAGRKGHQSGSVREYTIVASSVLFK